MTDLEREYQEVMEKEQAEIKQRDQRMKTKGFTHRVVAWIHNHGDDTCVDIYWVGEPAKCDVHQQLKKSGSLQLDDYQVVKL